MSVICFWNFFFFFWIAQHEERPLCHVHIVTSHFLIAQDEERPLYHVHMVTSHYLIAQHEERPLYHVHMVTSRWVLIISIFPALPSKNQSRSKVTFQFNWFLYQSSEIQRKTSL